MVTMNTFKIILFLSVVLISSILIKILKSYPPVTHLVRQSPSTSSKSSSNGKSGEEVVFHGTLKKGRDTKGKEFCYEGMYLVAPEGSFLLNQTSALLLRSPAKTDTEGSTGNQNYEMVKFDTNLLNMQVEVIGIYPTQASFCEALTCGCEDYILARSIEPFE